LPYWRFSTWRDEFTTTIIIIKYYATPYTLELLVQGVRPSEGWESLGQATIKPLHLASYLVLQSCGLSYMDSVYEPVVSYAVHPSSSSSYPLVETRRTGDYDQKAHPASGPGASSRETQLATTYGQLTDELTITSETGQNLK
jgi:hypothetical protein